MFMFVKVLWACGINASVLAVTGPTESCFPMSSLRFSWTLLKLAEVAKPLTGWLLGAVRSDVFFHKKSVGFSFLGSSTGNYLVEPLSFLLQFERDPILHL